MPCPSHGQPTHHLDDTYFADWVVLLRGEGRALTQLLHDGAALCNARQGEARSARRPALIGERRLRPLRTFVLPCLGEPRQVVAIGKWRLIPIATLPPGLRVDQCLPRLHVGPPLGDEPCAGASDGRNAKRARPCPSAACMGGTSSPKGAVRLGSVTRRTAVTQRELLVVDHLRGQLVLRERDSNVRPSAARVRMGRGRGLDSRTRAGEHCGSK